MDERILPYIAVVIVSLFVSIYVRRSYTKADKLKKDRAAGTLDKQDVLLETFNSLLLWPLGLFAAGWVDMVLWNMLADRYGLPTLDLFSALILGTLINSLFWTTAGIRRVWVENQP